MACGTNMVACVLEQAEGQGRVALGKYMGLSRVNRGGGACVFCRSLALSASALVFQL